VPRASLFVPGEHGEPDDRRAQIRPIGPVGASLAAIVDDIEQLPCAT
jgi:hypothetical protein